MLKGHVKRKLVGYVRKYFKKHHPKLIVVAGSVGKTTTKTAIATVLAQKYRIGMDPEDHNSDIGVPLAILGITYPPLSELKKRKTWRRIFKAARMRIKWPDGVDVIIQELGTDHPGELAEYAKYLTPDIAVITSVAPEHTANFPNGLADIATEELSVANFSKMALINSDDIDDSFAGLVTNTNVTTYGLERTSEYRFETDDATMLDGYDVKFFAPEFGSVDSQNQEYSDKALSATIHLVGDHSLRAAVAAGAIGAKLGMTGEEVVAGLNEIRPAPGRMNLLEGVRNTLIIDDTYNSSPSAAIAALLTLYKIPTNQRIAILGSMNELGAKSAEYHTEVGKQCDPLFLDWVITIGEDAARYLAPAARENGCQVASFPGPVAAGAFANKVTIREHTVILVKGSQDNVYAEEAVKILLAHTEDISQLVRQGEDWMDKTNDYIQSLRDIKQDDNEA
jgi:UDP-N-acetylmuramoyl-tripeptide--D-alanyl-D-alanine ligase